MDDDGLPIAGNWGAVTGIEAIGDDLFITNSHEGTIKRIQDTGAGWEATVIVSQLSRPEGLNKVGGMLAVVEVGRQRVGLVNPQTGSFKVLKSGLSMLFNSERTPGTNDYNLFDVMFGGVYQNMELAAITSDADGNIYVYENGTHNVIKIANLNSEDEVWAGLTEDGNAMWRSAWDASTAAGSCEWMGNWLASGESSTVKACPEDTCVSMTCEYGSFTVSVAECPEGWTQQNVPSWLHALAITTCRDTC